MPSVSSETPDIPADMRASVAVTIASLINGSISKGLGRTRRLLNKGLLALRELGRSECVEQRPVRFAGV